MSMPIAMVGWEEAGLTRAALCRLEKIHPVRG